MATLTTPIKASLQTGYSSPRFVLKAGDTLPVIRVQIVSTFGAADLTDAVVTFRWWPAGCGCQAPEMVFEAVATIEDAPKGIVSYAWVNGDTDVPNTYACEWVVEQGGKQFTAPNDSAVELLILPRY
jgi:hypothetical protein